MAQILLNSLVGAASYTLMGFSFALIYRTARFFHFAHGAAYTLGAYLVLLLASQVGIPWCLAFVLAALGTGCLGWSMDFVVYGPLRRKSDSALPPLLASLGLYVALENAVALIWGDAPKFLPAGSWSTGIQVLDGRVTWIQLVQLGVSAGVVTLAELVLRTSRFGVGLRAVADDGELAAVSGVPAARLLSGAFCVGSAMAGVAGGLTAIDIGAAPTMGMPALMMGMVAMIVGGGRIGGLLAGAGVLSLSQNLGVWLLGGEWQEALTLAVLFVFLLIRPQGLLGGVRQPARS